LTYVIGPRYIRHLVDCQAAAVLVGLDVDMAINGKTLIRVEYPEFAFAALLNLFHPPREQTEAVHPTAIIGAGVSLGDGVHIGPYVVIEQDASIGTGTVVGAHSYLGHGVSIGEDCRIDPGCSVMEGATLGDRVRLRCGARVSSDGFGFTTGPAGAVKLQQIGRCLIGDDVEIGANTTVDRGALADTVVGAGTKIDNLVQIGHNCRIGKHCFIASQAGIAGSTVLGDGVQVGGQTGFAGHLTIGDGASIVGRSGVISDVPSGESWSGFPARPHRQWLRASAGFHKLPDILRRLSVLERAAEDSDSEEA
jgi:UDP-3-O-[3-hydroxymyristoyl] glucosamine N-acyltransferase